MGLFNKGLLGMIAKQKRRNDLYNLYASAAQNSQSKSTTSTKKSYQCRYCGRLTANHEKRPPNNLSRCPNSPYNGTHRWEEL